MFSNDIALFSQKACSSPKQIIIIDPNLDFKKSYKFLNSFLKDCDLQISLMNELEEFYTLNNLKSSCELAANIHEDCNTIKLANIFGLYSNEKNELFNDFEFENCCFLIRHIKEIHEINNFLKDNNQTIVEIGLSQSERDILIRIASPLGTDRIVSAGKALNMDIFWDGYDTVGIMSRYVQYSQNG